MAANESATLWPRLARIAPLVLFLAVAAILLLDARHIDLRAIQRLLAAIAPWRLALLGVAGVAAVAAMSLYDMLAARALGIVRRRARSLRTGLVASGISNVVGLSGLTGSGLRVLLLAHDDVDTIPAIRYAGLVSLSLPLGLAALCVAVIVSGSSIPETTGLPNWLVWGVLAIFASYLPAYALIGRMSVLRRGRFAALPKLSTPQIGAFIVASLFEWLLAALVFWACLFTVDLNLPVNIVLGAFVLASATGIASMLPGGIGVFDVTLTTLLVANGGASNSVIAALVLYRCSYYLVPLIVALFLGADLLRSSRLATTLRAHPLVHVLHWPLARIAELSIVILSWLTALAGIVLLSGAAFPNLLARSKLVHDWLPLTVIEASHLASVVVGLTLIAAARGLSLHLERALWLSIVLLGAGASMGLARGLDWGTSLLLAATALLLFFSRDAFDLKGSLGRQLGAWQWTLALIIALGIYLLLGLALYDPEALRPLHFHAGVHGPSYARGALVAVVSVILLLIWTWPRWPRPQLSLPTRAELDALRNWLNVHGSNGYSHLLMLGDKSLFYTDNDRALVGFAAIRNRLIALGDPAGDADAREQAIADFRHFAERAHCTPVFYHVMPENLALYLDNGFALFKLGELARVDLRNFTMSGKSNADRRGAINRGVRLGMIFELVQPPFSIELIDEMRIISDDWIGENGIEKGFSLGRFDLDYLAQAPVALVRDEQARLQAFASILPSYGHREEYSIDLMRHRTDAPSGTMDFLFVSLMQSAAAEGYDWFSLGLAPLAGVGDTPWASTAEQLARLAFEHGSRFYNYKGLRAFKDKWKPEWQSTYLAYPPQASLSRIQLDIIALVAGGYRRILGHR